MKIILSLVGYLISLPLFLLWLLLCGFLAFLGALIPEKRIGIDLEQVKRENTVCRVMYRRGLLTDEEYNFETSEVAVQYDELTFRGYLFILAPLICLLRCTQFLDTFVLFVVRKWMAIHRYKKINHQVPKTFFARLAKVCVHLAGLVGQLLYVLKPL